jgi:peroxiredoxin
MKRFAIALALMISASPAFAALKPGTRATDFTTQAVLAGKADTFNLNKALKNGPVVLYFYPKALGGMLFATVNQEEFNHDYAQYFS